MGQLYQLTCPNGKSYIGVTEKTARERFRTHVHQRHSRAYALYAAIRRYGWQAIQVRTLVIGAMNYLLELEQQAIKVFGTKAPNGYNLTDGGEVPRGLTAESRAKMSALHKGNAHHSMPHSAETKARMSAARKGRQVSDAHRERTRKAWLGNTIMVGRKLSEETRRTMSGSHKGRTFSEEHRANIALAAIAREDKRRKARTVE